MEILPNQTYEMKNVISYRAKMTQHDIDDILDQLDAFITENDLKKSGCVTTVTFSVNAAGAARIMDTEILCPVDKACEVPRGFTFKPEFRLSNAVKITHKGSSADMQESINKLVAYINQNKLTPLTCVYKVMIAGSDIPGNADDMVVDMYIGVSDNIL